MTIINQFYYPTCFESHCKYAKENYGLNEYHDKNLPSFFFSTLALKTKIFKQHNSIAILIINNDLNPLLQYLKENKNANLYFISTSKLISEHLDSLNIEYIEFPFFPSIPIKANPVKKGEHIYFYGSGPWNKTYGGDIVKKIHKEHFSDIPIISTSYLPKLSDEKKKEKLEEFKRRGVQHLTKDEVNEAYRNSFVSIRLTKFDGLSDTVQCLGLMGIKCVWNGGTPSGLSFKNENDVINHIKNERKTIGEVDENLAKSVENFLNPKNYPYIFDSNSYIEKINGKQFPIIFT